MKKFEKPEISMIFLTDDALTTSKESDTNGIFGDMNNYGGLEEDDG